MRNRIYLFVVIAGALMLAACSGGGSAVPDGPADSGIRDTANLAISPGDRMPDGSPTQEWMDASWEAWLANPGVPGEDYDPSLINVSYNQDSLGYRSTSSARLPEGMSAAEQPLSVLRKDPGYEPITDAIAAANPVTIDIQVYYGEVNFASFRVNEGEDSAAVLEAIRRDFGDYIDYAAYAMLYKQQFTPIDPYYASGPSGRLWSSHRIGCSDAWDYTTGVSTEWVADVDTGVHVTHQEFTNTVLDPATLAAGMGPGTFFDLANDDNTMEDTSDSGHGTFIAGIIGASGNDSMPMVGIAYGCRIVPVKISNGGTASDSRLSAGCLLGLEAGARSINLSWGAYHHNPEMLNMVNEIYNNGGLMFGAAGNDNVDEFHLPSDYSNAISVGSTDPNDRKADFSNYSTAVDIAAPGVPLTSTGHHSNDDYHEGYTGTSFSAPMVAAAAALLWSYDPDLTNDEVRDLLITTGAPIGQHNPPASNFPDVDPPILRLDIAAALAEIDAVRVTAPEPDRIIHSGTFTLTPQVNGEPDIVQAYMDGVLVSTLASAPYDFEFDTTGIDFKQVELNFVATKGIEESADSVTVLVDNSAGSYPVVEGFESADRDFLPIDLKGYSLGVLQEAKDIAGPGANWTQDAVAGQGPAFWHSTTAGTFEGTTSLLLSSAQSSYGAHELDALVSRRVKLTGVANGTLVFYQRYNIEDGGSDFDRAWVYVTPDFGDTLIPAELKTGGDAYFSGYQSAWSKAEVDLSGFNGLVHVILLFESDSIEAGEQEGQPDGWWVDKITVSSNYNENVPTLSGVSVNPYSYYGDVPGLVEIPVSVGDTENVNRVRYILDVVPLGTITLDDKIVDSSEDPFGGTITNLPGLPNQLANLRVQYFDAENNAGPEIVLPVYIFNLLGDVNADNIVDDLDTAAYDGMVGLVSTDPGYIPLFDSNLDGEITEGDASAVGYFWGESI